MKPDDELRHISDEELDLAQIEWLSDLLQDAAETDRPILEPHRQADILRTPQLPPPIPWHGHWQVRVLIGAVAALLVIALLVPEKATNDPRGALKREQAKIEDMLASVDSDREYWQAELDRNQAMQKLLPVAESAPPENYGDFAERSYIEAKVKYIQTRLGEQDLALDERVVLQRQLEEWQARASGVIAPETTLLVSIAEDETFNGKYKVRPGGYILLPRLPRIFVAGKTLWEAADVIQQELQAQRILDNATVGMRFVEDVPEPNRMIADSAAEPPPLSADLAAQEDFKITSSVEGLQTRINELTEKRQGLHSEAAYIKSKIKWIENKLVDTAAPLTAADREKAEQDLRLWRDRLVATEEELGSTTEESEGMFEALREAVDVETYTAPVLPESVLEINVAEDETFNGRYAVRSGGYILLPRMPRIFVAGKTVEEAEQVIRQELKAQQILDGATVGLEVVEAPASRAEPEAMAVLPPVEAESLSRTRDHVLYFRGTEEDGAWEIPDGFAPTLLKSILRQDIDEDADLSRVGVIRLVEGQGIREEVDVQSILDGKSATADFQLQADDIVIIPKKERAKDVSDRAELAEVVIPTAEESQTWESPEEVEFERLKDAEGKEFAVGDALTSWGGNAAAVPQDVPPSDSYDRFDGGAEAKPDGEVWLSVGGLSSFGRAPEDASYDGFSDFGDAEFAGDDLGGGDFAGSDEFGAADSPGNAVVHRWDGAGNDAGTRAAEDLGYEHEGVLSLHETDQVRDVPDGKNAEVADLFFNAWDQATGNAGQVEAPASGDGEPIVRFGSISGPVKGNAHTAESANRQQVAGGDSRSDGEELAVTELFRHGTFVDTNGELSAPTAETAWFDDGNNGAVETGELASGNSTYWTAESALSAALGPVTGSGGVAVRPATPELGNEPVLGVMLKQKAEKQSGPLGGGGFAGQGEGGGGGTAPDLQNLHSNGRLADRVDELTDLDVVELTSGRGSDASLKWSQGGGESGGSDKRGNADVNARGRDGTREYAGRIRGTQGADTEAVQQAANEQTWSYRLGAKYREVGEHQAEVSESIPKLDEEDYVNGSTHVDNDSRFALDGVVAGKVVERYQSDRGERKKEELPAAEGETDRRSLSIDLAGEFSERRDYRTHTGYTEDVREGLVELREAPEMEKRVTEQKALEDESGPDSSYDNYEVMKGDSLWKIARESGVTVDELVAVNGINEGDVLQIDQQLKIPSPPKPAPLQPESTIRMSPKRPATTAAPEPEPVIGTPKTLPHVVGENDTLEIISGMYNSTPEWIKQANEGLRNNADLTGTFKTRTITVPSRGIANPSVPATEPEPVVELPPAPSEPAPPVNPFVLSDKDALSTFALESEAASYVLSRRYIRGGYQPPPAIVRMEEFINAFDYNYPSRSDKTFTVHATAAPAPFGKDLTLLKIGVRGKVIGRDGRKPAHLVFVIDASGSMARPDRLPMIRESLGMLLSQMGAEDRVSLVAYASRAHLLLDGVPATQRAHILQTMEGIECTASTNVLDGVRAGYQLAARHFRPNAVNRVILCSDGVANVGTDDAEAMLRMVQEQRRQGIAITTVGVGAGSYNDNLMEQLANRGDGNYVYIDSLAEAQRVFVDNFSATLNTIARDVKIQVAFNPERVRRYRLIGYENRAVKDQDFRNDKVDAGEIGSGQSATALYELELREGAEATDLGTVFVRYKPLDSDVATEFASRLRADLPRQLTPAEDPRFFLAAAVAEFAEILRQSPHANRSSLHAVEQMVLRTAQGLPHDSQVAELLELVRGAKDQPVFGQ